MIFSRFKKVAPRMPGPPRVPPRVMAYCASNTGLGHYMELVRAMAALRRRRPEVEILLATDAREKSMTEREGFQRLDLPGFEFIEGTEFKERPRDLDVDNATLRKLRAGALEGAVRAFKPHLIFMDGNPHGKRDEMLPALRLARNQGARAIMLMRDIPAPQGEKHKLAGAPADMLKHAAHYDRLLISSEREFFDVAEAYKWPLPLREKLRYIGFIADCAALRPRAEVFAAHPELDPARPLIVAGFGGGWAVDGSAERLLDALAAHRSHENDHAQMALSTGPAVDAFTLGRLEMRAREMGGVVVAKFISDFSAMLAVADMAVIQAGFTVYEILESAVPVVLAPRAHTSREQEERAARLARLPGIRVIDGAKFAEADWPALFAWGFGGGHAARRTGWRYNGAEQAAAEALALLEN